MSSADVAQEPRDAEQPEWLSVEEFMAAEIAESRRNGVPPTSANSRETLEFLTNHRGMILRIEKGSLWSMFDRYGFFAPTGELLADLPYSEAHRWLRAHEARMAAQSVARELENELAPSGTESPAPRRAAPRL
ncbi:MAG: hypothetical protein V4669_11550 [Pseudomonadota bacterium]